MSTRARVTLHGARRRVLACAVAVAGLACAVVQPAPTPTTAAAGTPGVPPWSVELSAASAERFAVMALDCVHRQYPNKLSHVLASDEDVGSPLALHPVFYGCFDWHSAVHGHWLLVRLARRFPQASFVAPAREALGRSLDPDAIAKEVAYLRRDDRSGFERPYGLAWLLQLGAELRAWDDPQARAWAAALAPLEHAAADRLATWIPKLGYPIRSGEHSQTGFAFGLALDWANAVGDERLAGLIEHHARRLHAEDRACAVHLEPSGHDFLSPCLGAADLMRRVLPPTEFAAWLERSLPDIADDGTVDWLQPATSADRTDGKLVHLDGLNLSRAWMLDGIEQGLPPTDPRRAALRLSAHEHAVAGLASVSDEHYAGGHWLASFAVYLATRRGRSFES
ncbi:MAG: DUF2891 domain-containing protein [Deltaproteobacteria bacterium]|nr:DUF2891 domain-containing protein [Deltaproteobacteria bacterium]